MKNGAEGFSPWTCFSIYPPDWLLHSADSNRAVSCS